MSDVELIGVPGSTYVRAVRMVCEELQSQEARVGRLMLQVVVTAVVIF
jgi:hypothetical protein